MISIQGKPDKFSLLGERKPFVVFTDKFLVTQGTLSTLVIQFNAGLDNGDYFTLSYSTTSLRFNVRDILIGDGNEIISKNPGETLENWVYKVARDLKKNYYLLNFFNVSAFENKIQIIARNTGSKYNLTLTIPESIDPNDMFELSNTAGNDQSVRLDLAVVVQSMIQNTGNSQPEFGQIIEQFYNPDLAGKAYFTINDLIASFLESSFSKVSSPGLPVRRNENILRRYYLYLTESYGTPPQYQSMLMSDVFFVVNGTIPVHHQNTFRFTSFMDWMIQDRKFLTHHPKEKKVLPTQFEKLFFIYTAYVIPADLEIFLRMKLYFSDTTSSANIDFQNGLTGISEGEVIEVDCGYTQLGIDILTQNYPGKVLSYYTLQLMSQSMLTGTIPVSEIRTYYPDTDYYEFSRQFIFRNSLGGFDTLLCTTKSSLETEIQKSISEFDEPLMDEGIKASKKEFNIQPSLLANHTTGYFTLDQVNWLQDFFISDLIYEIQDEKFTPCRITSTNLSLMDEMESMNSIEFQVEYLKSYESEDDQISFSEFTTEFKSDFL